MNEPSGIRLHEFVAWLRATAAERAKTSPTSGVDLDYAADLIERTIPIPVGERLPEPWIPVLVFDLNMMVWRGGMLDMHVVPTLRFSESPDENCPPYRISHWLPKPPKPE